MPAASLINGGLQYGVHRTKRLQSFQRLPSSCALKQAVETARLLDFRHHRPVLMRSDKFRCCSVCCPQRKTGLKTEQESLAAADVSQRLLISRAKELIA